MAVSDPIVEVFIETIWNETARDQRDERARLLSEQGYDCTCETLYNGLNQRVFVLRAEPQQPEPVADVPRRRERDRPSDRRPKPRSKVREFLNL